MATVKHDWYLKEWLAVLDCTREQLREKTGWTHRINSQLVNRKTRWNRDHLSQAAIALNLAPWELLMHPVDAMEVRSLRASISLAAERREQYKQAPGDAAPQWKTGTDE